jgi:protein farnesyltransferase subunit beta
MSSLQTYEGGFASASSAVNSQFGAPTSPLGEAHGGYTSCALASWLLLRQAGYLSNHDGYGNGGADGEPTIDLGRLARWLIHLQEPVFGLGGFRGRTNKLVDGCYSWWVGGCFDLLAALGVPTLAIVPTVDEGEKGGWDQDDEDADWEDNEGETDGTTMNFSFGLTAAQ